MLQNDHIHSLLARGITDVNYMPPASELLRRPDTPGSVGRKPGKEFDRLFAFSAFIAKVQHNFLWNDFNRTFRLIHEFGMEIEIFAAYLPSHQENKRKNLTNNQKTDQFIRFLTSYVAEKKSKHYQIVYNVARHEDAVRKLKQNIIRAAAGAPSSSPSASSVVKINGCLLIHKLCIVPEEIMALPLSPETMRVSRKKEYYVYWLEDPKKQLQVVELATEAKKVLELVNNSATLASVMARASKKVGAENARDVLQFLMQHQIIYLA